MSSRFDTPTEWALRWLDLIPYKLIEQTGSFESKDASLTYVILIQAEDLDSFIALTLPRSEIEGALQIPQYTKPPIHDDDVSSSILANFAATKLSFKAFQDKPNDPWEVHRSESGDALESLEILATYASILEVTIEYNPIPAHRDGKTYSGFLEIEAHASSSILHTTVPSAKFQNQDAVRPAALPAGNMPESYYQKFGPNKDTTTEAVKDPGITTLIIIPQVEWTVKWAEINKDYFEEKVLPRLRYGAGKINDSIFYAIFEAPAETVLFESYGFRSNNSWRTEYSGQPTYDLDLKFTEKHILWNDGLVVGWNHIWDPKEGWRKVKIDNGTRYPYEATDLDQLFYIV